MATQSSCWQPQDVLAISRSFWQHQSLYWQHKVLMDNPKSPSFHVLIHSTVSPPQVLLLQPGNLLSCCMCTVQQRTLLPGFYLVTSSLFAQGSLVASREAVKGQIFACAAMHPVARGFIANLWVTTVVTGCWLCSLSLPFALLKQLPLSKQSLSTWPLRNQCGCTN